MLKYRRNELHELSFKFMNLFSLFSIMGQGADTGVIPRFCEDLFSRVEAETKDRVSCVFTSGE